MRLSIKSRKLGVVFNFWMPDSGGYIRLESEGYTGTLGQQITETDGSGSCVSSTPGLFEETCRSWYRRTLRAEMKERNWRYGDR